MLNKQNFFKSIVLILLMGNFSAIFAQTQPCYRLKTSLNAFSFNAPLLAGKMDLFQLLDFCSEQNFDAVDITGYYFKGYPAVPTDEYIYAVKKKAKDLGIEISGTGVRNDFTIADKTKRKEQVQLVKDWIDVAQKLSAPVIRVFAGGKGTPEGYTWEQTATWMVEDFKECVAYGKSKGIIVAVQNHNDFIRTPEHVHYLFQKVNDPWFGLIMDTGGFRSGDTYADTAETIKYAVNWQLKEKIFVKNVEMDTDYEKMINIIKKSCYKGYLPIETLNDGDPATKVKTMMEKIRKYL